MSWQDSVIPTSYAPLVVDPLLWNYHLMTQQGIPQDHALRLANAGLSWRDTEPLVERGCPPETILRLLLPDDHFAPEVQP